MADKKLCSMDIIRDDEGNVELYQLLVGIRGTYEAHDWCEILPGVFYKIDYLTHEQRSEEWIVNDFKERTKKHG